MIELNKKTIIAVSVLVLVSLVSILIFVNLPKQKQSNYFTAEPEPWIEKSIVGGPEDYVISVRRATADASELVGNKQEYLTSSGIVAFFTHGYYRGNQFDTRYIDPKFYEENLIGKSDNEKEGISRQYVKMASGREMNPQDGVIDGLIIAKLNSNENFDIFIFVDEDWKKSIGNTNLVWGDDFTDRTKLSVRKFDFSRSKYGIYVDVVKDVTWKKSSPVAGGLIVGEVDIDTTSDNPAERNLTFLYIR